MRRIFTFSFIAIALSLVSFKSFGQTTCSNSTTGTLSDYNPVAASATFNNPNGTYTEFFPIAVYSSTPPTAIPFYLTLSAPSGNPSFSATITIKWGAGGVNSFTCTTITGLVPNTTATNFFFTIQPATPLPVSTNFQISVLLTNTGNKPVTLSGAGLDKNALTPSGAALPVKFQTFEATPSNNSVALKWIVATEENLSGYDIERSIDGKNFSKIGFISANNQSSYTFVDGKSSATTYYRIRSVDLDGRYAFSTIAIVKAGQSAIMLNAFPSPFTNSFNLDHGTAAAGSLITISGQDGRTIKTIIPTVGSQRTFVDLSASKTGIYLVRYKASNGEVETLKILKQ